MTVEWDKEAIEAFVAGALVYQRDARSLALQPPDWVQAAAGRLDRRDTAERIAAVHPDDRGALLHGWGEAMARPGEVVEYEVRATVDGVPVRERTRVVNLLDHPLIGGLLFAMDVSEVPAFEDDEDDALVDGRFGSPNWAFTRLDTAGLILDAEGPVEALFGRPADDLIGDVLTNFLHPDTVAQALRMWLDLMAEPGGTRTGRQRLLRPDGAEMWVEATVMHRERPDGAGEISILLYDIAARRSQEQDLRASREEFRLLAEEMPAPVFRADATGKVLFGNGRWQELATQHDPDGDGHLRAVVHPDDWPVLADLLAATTRTEITSGAGATVEVRDTLGTGVLAVTCRAVGSSESEQRSVFGSIQDVTATAELRRRLQEDPITGTLSRLGLEAALDAALESSPDTTVVLFLDLDGFKAVNDTYGHDVGDLVLGAVGRRLRATVRPSDAVGRYGGDEFVVVCGRAGGPDAEDKIESRIAAALEESVTWDGGAWKPAASIGRARARPGEQVAEVLRRADLAMFDEKRRRRSSRAARLAG